MVENVKVKKVELNVKSKNAKHEREHLENSINLVIELNKIFVSIKVYIYIIYNI